MKLTNLFNDSDGKRAVSPVIGVILMVAITVILAAVIASFVLGLGGSQQSTPQASFSWDFTEMDNSSGTPIYGVAEVGHDGGDSIPASELNFRGSGFAGGDTDIDDDGTTGDADITLQGKWPAGQASGSIGEQSAVVGGDNLEIGVSSDFELSLVWEPQEGDTSATLSEKTGPDA